GKVIIHWFGVYDFEWLLDGFLLKRVHSLIVDSLKMDAFPAGNVIRVIDSLIPYFGSSSIDGAMVYVTSWDEFVERTVQLFRASPESTRYCMKYRHCDGKLVLKVTDNKECLKFKTDQAQEAKKMEKLNNIFFTLMARGPD
ncbi:hypothetical protein Goari_012368, partial [Gossypium aridum]|nr:hypothetical protein [Gossypium aridum]